MTDHTPVVNKSKSLWGTREDTILSCKLVKGGVSGQERSMYGGTEA